MTGCDHDEAVAGLFNLGNGPRRMPDESIEAFRLRVDGDTLAAAVELQQDPGHPPTVSERTSARAVVSCYFCGKRADGLTSNDLPSCANCRALPQRKR